MSSIALLLIMAILIPLLILLWLLLTPTGKAFLSRQKAAEEAVKTRIQHARKSFVSASITGNPDKHRGQKISQAFKDLKETKQYWSSRVILAGQICREVYQAAPSILRDFPPGSQQSEAIFEFLENSAVPSQELYNLSLSALEAHPSDSKAKQLVLKIGRYHFGKMRGGKVTIYDEQAIQNDIQVRSK